MKSAFLVLVLAFASLAQAATPAFIKSSSSGWSVSTAGGITPNTAGDTLLIPIYCQGTGTIGTPTDSSGATPILDLSTAHWWFYRETSVTTAARTLTFTSTGCSTSKYLMIEVSGLGSFDKATSEATGTGTSVASSSLTPAANDEFLLAGVLTSAGAITFSTWTNLFTQDKTINGGPSAADAYLVQTSGPTSVNAGVTLSGSETWYTVLAAYAPPGYVPNASFIISSGHYLMSNGKPVITN